MTDVIDQKDFPKYLNSLTEDFKRIDYTKALNAVYEVQRKKVSRNFLTQSDAAGKPWDPLRPSTVAKKGHSRILVDSARMVLSVTRPAHGDQIKDISGRAPAFLVYGTSVEWAGFHQDGTSKIPQREFLAIDDETVDKMADVVADAIVEELKR